MVAAESLLASVRAPTPAPTPAPAHAHAPAAIVLAFNYALTGAALNPLANYVRR